MKLLNKNGSINSLCFISDGMRHRLGTRDNGKILIKREDGAKGYFPEHKLNERFKSVIFVYVSELAEFDYCVDRWLYGKKD